MPHTPHPSDNISLENVHDVNIYHAPTPDQAKRHVALQSAAEAFQRVILENSPDSVDRDLALHHARIARMMASSAVALEPQLEQVPAKVET